MNDEPILEDIEDFLVLNYDFFTSFEREAIRRLLPGQRAYGGRVTTPFGPWTIERIR